MRRFNLIFGFHVPAQRSNESLWSCVSQLQPGAQSRGAEVDESKDPKLAVATKELMVAF